MADVEVENILREIRDRVYAEQTALAPSAASGGAAASGCRAIHTRVRFSHGPAPYQSWHNAPCRSTRSQPNGCGSPGSNRNTAAVGPSTTPASAGRGA